MIPGLQAVGVGGYVLGINASGNTPFDLADAFGNPSVPIHYRLFVSPSVVRGSTTLGVPSIDATGLHEDSTGIWVVRGILAGRGGKGVSIFVGGGGTFYSIPPGGGGGGAGAQVGAGGTSIEDATAGDPGTLTTGGAAGADGTISAFADLPTSGEDGGDAVWLNHAVTATVDGGIRGGGGGGGVVVSGPGFIIQPGGDLDQDGLGSAYMGLAGKAVKLIGAKAAFDYTGSGTVGAVSA